VSAQTGEEESRLDIHLFVKVPRPGDGGAGLEVVRIGGQKGRVNFCNLCGRLFLWTHSYLVNYNIQEQYIFVSVY